MARLTEGLSMGEMVVLVFLGLFSLVVYFIPSIVAALRNHPNGNAIAILNILTGWTFIGWVVAMVWAFTAIDDRRYRR